MDKPTIITNILSGLLGGVVVAVINHLFTRRKIAAETDKLKAEADKVSAEAEKIRFETKNMISQMVTIQDIQLSKEIVFNKDIPETSRKLYWIDERGLGHLILDDNVALLFASHKGFLGLGNDLINKIEIGADLPLISKDSFYRIKGDYFVIIDDKIFYLPSVSMVYKFWDDISKVPEIKIEEFRKYPIYK